MTLCNPLLYIYSPSGMIDHQFPFSPRPGAWFSLIDRQFLAILNNIVAHVVTYCVVWGGGGGGGGGGDAAQRG